MTEAWANPRESWLHYATAQPDRATDARRPQIGFADITLTPDAEVSAVADCSNRSRRNPFHFTNF
jgi:hypothetical protein